MLISSLKKAARSFTRDQNGHVTVEILIIMPIMLWLFGVGWVYFDAMRQQDVNQKANYAIGDTISRETNPIDAAYLQNSHNLLQLLTQSTGTETDLRVSVVKYKEQQSKWVLVWSAVVGNQQKLTNGDMSDYVARLPSAAAGGQQLILVETWDDHKPIFNVGLDPFEIRTYSFNRPRYSPQMLYTLGGENNGWGNGDQTAPGASLCTNNAENQTDCTAPVTGI
ncbi:hypothetical protein [uncultured Pelagimonas sp.]|uniref:TadE/TadG family type IV pilus assembly protein n=1 Tax=uncultured Pelagimonas sp. TaxID=1618102 RepID=UPI0026381981|nr:hypothetical protein [uncultured Pelagimonas sp.]